MTLKVVLTVELSGGLLSSRARLRFTSRFHPHANRLEM